jgi:hypothetical protein
MSNEESIPEETLEEQIEGDEPSNESGAESEDDPQDPPEGETDYRAKLNATNRFLEKEGYKFEDGKWGKGAEPAPKPKAQDSSTDEVTLSRLEVRGVMDPDDQNYVMRFAKTEGISPIEALSDPIVKDRLDKNKRTRESANATPRSNNRTNNQQDELAAAVRKYQQTGELPDDLALASKVGDAINNGA